MAGGTQRTSPWCDAGRNGLSCIAANSLWAHSRTWGSRPDFDDKDTGYKGIPGYSDPKVLADAVLAVAFLVCVYHQNQHYPAKDMRGNGDTMRVLPAIIRAALLGDMVKSCRNSSSVVKTSIELAPLVGGMLTFVCPQSLP